MSLTLRIGGPLGPPRVPVNGQYFGISSPGAIGLARPIQPATVSLTMPSPAAASAAPVVGPPRRSPPVAPSAQSGGSPMSPVAPTPPPTTNGTALESTPNVVPLETPFAATSQHSVQCAWEEFLRALIEKDVDKLMPCYEDACHVRHYENSDGIKTDFVGSDSVREMYSQLFDELLDLSDMEVILTEVDEDAGQVFLVWECPESGVLSATSTFIYARNFKIWKQNSVFTRVPVCAAALMTKNASQMDSPEFAANGLALTSPSALENVETRSYASLPAPGPGLPSGPPSVLPQSSNAVPKMNVLVQQTPVGFQAVNAADLARAMSELKAKQQRLF